MDNNEINSSENTSAENMSVKETASSSSEEEHTHHHHHHHSSGSHHSSSGHRHHRSSSEMERRGENIEYKKLRKKKLDLMVKRLSFIVISGLVLAVIFYAIIKSDTGSGAGVFKNSEYSVEEINELNNKIVDYEEYINELENKVSDLEKKLADAGIDVSGSGDEENEAGDEASSEE